MTIIGFLVLVAICGVVYWVVGQFDFIAQPFRKIIQVVLIAIVAIAAIVLIAGLFGYHTQGLRLR